MLIALSLGIGGFLQASASVEITNLRCEYLTEPLGIDADSIAGLIPLSGQAVTHFSWRRKQGIPDLQPTIDRTAPLYHVRPDAPPYVIICGDRELELFGRYEENAYLWRMLRLTGRPDATIYELDGYNHGYMAHPAFHILKASIARLLPH